MSLEWANVFIREPRECLKIAEIVLGLICLGVNRGVILMGGRPDWFLLSYVTPSSFILITIVLLLTKLIENPIKPPLAELMFNGIGFLLYLVSGSCSIQYYTMFLTSAEHQAAGIAYGVFALLASIIYIVDAVLPHWDNFPSATAIRSFATKNLRIPIRV